MSKSDFKLAQEDLKDVIEQFKDRIRRSDDKESVEMWRDDIVDIKEILVMFTNMEFGKAYKKAQYLDTAVREELPDSFWEIAGIFVA